jgi:hypothetical protein
VSAHPSGWSCQRYGDVADDSSDSFDSNAVEEAEQYLEETVGAVLGERGLSAAPEELEGARMVGLLTEICMESPDLLLEAAALRVADGLP